MNQAIKVSQQEKEVKIHPCKVNFGIKATGKINCSLYAKINFGYAKKPTTQEYFDERRRNYQRIMKSRELFDKYLNDWSDLKKPIEKKYISLKIGLGISMPISFWVNDKKIKKLTVDELINDQLNQFKFKVQKLHDQLKLSGAEITPELFKEQIFKYDLLNKYSKGVEPKTIHAIPEPEIKLVLFSDFIEQRLMYEHKLVKLGMLSEETVESCGYFKNRIKDFKYSDKRKGIKDRPLYISEMNEEIIANYLIYCQDVLKYGERTMDKEIKNFKKYFRLATGEGLSKFTLDKITTSTILKRKDIENKFVVYLSVPELVTVEQLDLAKLKFTLPDGVKNPYQFDICRAFFLLSSFCGGRRFSDYNKFLLQEDRANKGEFFIVDVSKKTDTPTKISAPDIAVRQWQMLMEIGGNKLPKIPSKFNKIIRRIAESAKIDELVMLNKQGETAKKYSLLSAHTSRRNYATNMIFEYEQTVSDVMKWMGEKSIVQFQKYVGLDLQGGYERSRDLAKKIKV